MAADHIPNSLELFRKSDSDLSRRERRKREMRDRIVSTARALFGERGYAETRVADICERADIAQKTFFNHFPAKLDVLRKIAQAGIEELLFGIEDIRKADLATRDRIFRFFDTVGEHIAEAGPQNRELLVEVVHLISGDAAERSEQVVRLHAAFSGIVHDGLALGDVTHRHDPQALTEMILGAYYVLIFNYANLDDFPVRERGRAAARILADALAPHPEERNGST
jgi:AcrR family transcriptional regulator